MTHFPDLTTLVHAPRALHIKFPLGSTFGEPGRKDLQQKIVLEMLHAAETSSQEKIYSLPYRWKRD
ncbi:hypothetical protein C6Y45_07760 [Alkalicoccus saliphilus]|uniref:Uncharacterized protein n=1 Tax=Alkalicoccus saliphilus TaxID=200989 RepID=A0A2T4U6Q1_9BACI|nr:hypothetical protein C6Y45_07760 [Alkalicoccus saliphilus]